MTSPAIGTFKGFGVTLKQIFRKPLTQQYPEYKRPLYPRFRGRHRLHLHENGLEKCVGCSLCAAACPADCIRVVPAENTPSNRVSAGERYARIYEINLSRCIFCGYCELACPFDAITLAERVRALRVLARRPDLHEGHAAGAADEARAGRRSRAVRHAHPGVQGVELMGNALVWLVWFVAVFACLGSAVAVISFTNPFFSALALIGNLASLAALYLLLSAEFVAAAQVLVYAGAVMVMFLFVIAYLGDRAGSPWAGGPSVQTLFAVAAAGALLVEVDHRPQPLRGRQPQDRRPHQRRFRQPRADRARLPLRPPARLRDHLDRAARRSGRRRDPRRRAHAPGRGRMMGPDVIWYVAVSAALFAIGALGVLLRRSPLTILLSLEIMLNGANLALIAFARHAGDPTGQIFALTVMAVAASEVVVGLGLIVALARDRLPLDVDKLRHLRG